MRTCAACGYMTLSTSEACMHCGAPIAAPSPKPALVTTGGPASASAAPSAPPAPLAPPPTPRPAPDLGYTVRLGSPAPAAPTLSPTMECDSWSSRGGKGGSWSVPPDVPRPVARTSGRRRILSMVAVLAIAGAAVGVRTVLQRDGLPPGTSEFAAGRGVSYTAPDASFEAKFPRTPVEKPQVFSAGSASVTLHLAQDQTDDYEIVAASMAMPVRLDPAQTDNALRDVLAAGAASQHAKITSQRRVQHGTASGIEASARVSDGYDARIMALTTGDHIYFLGVHAKTGTQRLYDALVASFVIL